MSHRYRLLLPLLLAHTACAYAETSGDEEFLTLPQQLTSISTGEDLALRRAPSIASIITAEDIKALGAKDLDEVLETVPGIHVSRSAINYFSTYTVRGIVGNTSNPQVLMLQNGTPTNSIYRGDKGKSWGGLSLENVARIEIMRGPGSALYGADAFAGVINIITKTEANAPGTDFGVRGGSFNSKDAWVRHARKLDDIDVAAYLHVGRTDGSRQTITADAATRLDRLFGTSASLAPGAVNTGYDAVDANIDLGYEKWRVRGGFMQRSNAGTGAGISSALDPVGKDSSERLTADLSWRDPQFAKYWSLGFSGSYLHNVEVASNYNMYPAGTRFATGTFPNGMIGSPARWEQQVRISGYASYSGFSSHKIRIGVGRDDLDLYKVRTLKNFLLNAAGVPTPDLAFNGGAVVDYSTRQPHQIPHRRIVNYLYAQDVWDIVRDWTLTAGVRHDSFSDFGSATTPRLALVWDASYNTTAKLLYGKAFRAPSASEQDGVNPVANGNPNLKPEAIETLEAAISWQPAFDTQVGLNVFHYSMSDTIRPVTNPVAGTGATYQNTGKQRGRGIELETKWDASSNLQFSGNYAWQRSIDMSTNQDVGYAPTQHINLRSNWRFSRDWLLGPQVNWVAGRKRPAGDTRLPVPDYTTADITLRSDRGRNLWDFSATVRNLFNANMIEPSISAATLPNDLPMAPRSIWLQANFNM